MTPFYIRDIQPGDNVPVAAIIRESLTEFGANKPGTVYYDETTDHLFELFQRPDAGYFVAVADEQVIGGGGIFPSPGLPEGTVELVKMYLHKNARGKGIGRALIYHALEYAKLKGYSSIYLETMPELKQALSTYEKYGFQYLDAPMGNTGHYGCDRWMFRKL